jgi:ribonuclease HI
MSKEEIKTPQEIIEIPEVPEEEQVFQLFTDGAQNMKTGHYAYSTIVDQYGNDWYQLYKKLFPKSQVFVPPGEYPKFGFTTSTEKKRKLGTTSRTVKKVRFGSESQQNNSAEIQAFKDALEIAIKMGPSVVQKISTDSKLVLDFWSKNRVNAQTRAKMALDCPEKLDLIKKTAELRETWEESGGQIGFVPGGDNPADLGFHRKK